METVRFTIVLMIFSDRVRMWCLQTTAYHYRELRVRSSVWRACIEFNFVPCIDYDNIIVVEFGFV